MAQQIHPDHVRFGRSLAAAAAGLALAAAGISGCGPEHPITKVASGEFPQEAYVWQRAWTPSVMAGIRESKGRVAGLVVLAAEVEWREGTPQLIRPKVEAATLDECGLSATLAVRIGPWGGPFDEGDPRTQQIVRWIGETLTQARQAGWQPPELQIDFDAATAKLGGYLAWLKVIQKAVAPLPVSFTALPAWLRSPTLREMAILTGRFVLQVHAVERARAEEPNPLLLDARSVETWIRQAAELGVPFRVALPTYRTAVGFDAQGRILGLDSEGPSRVWPPGTRVVTYRSPAADIAQLITEWKKSRPAAMSGVVWYRLPIPGEARNWTWSTLGPVMAGRAPTERLEVSRQGDNPVDLLLVNTGEAEAVWPAEVRAVLAEGAGEFAAADALVGYSVSIDPDQPWKALFRRKTDGAQRFLLPNGKKPLGWIRFSNDTAYRSLSIEIH